MARLELDITPKDKAAIARRGYHRWQQTKKTAKLYIATLFAMCEGKCPRCGVDMILSYSAKDRDRADNATLDHIIPISETMEHAKFGLQIMCKGCNSKKENDGLKSKRENN